ncbi:MAG: OsmC family protein [Candidatus Delongbacteria bacterium]|jgi:putative redox protein|nr:OsmC family protein [Candidatus Delongbacteria bacterium]
MTIMHTTYKGDLRTEATHLQSGNKIFTDAPLDNHGKGEAFSPTDLFTVSYSTCILTIMGLAAQNQGFSIDGATAETEKIMSKNPRRVGEIIIKFVFPHNDYTDREKKTLERIVPTCPVGGSLHPDIKQTITLSYKGE